MAAKNRLIIDTDPGCDDVLAILMAFAAKPEDLEVLLVSITFGNIDLQCCLRNVMATLSIIEKEQAWRRSKGRPEGFPNLKAHQPIVAMGAEGPLADQKVMADYFHGIDGLGGIHTSHPHLSPSDVWRSLFNLPSKNSSKAVSSSAIQETADAHAYFTPSTVASHKLILRILADNPPDTITIVAIGPMTNLALAAHDDVEIFLRVKEVVVMGGTIDEPGNITPVAEFNTYADTIAFARVLALTSKHPRSTMPPWPPSSTPETHLPPYPAHLSRRLNLTMVPLDITMQHVLTKKAFEAKLLSLGITDSKQSPLAEFMSAFLTPAWPNLYNSRGLRLHDPLAVYYAFTSAAQNWKVTHDEDIRIETAGQWTRGACVVDRRGPPKLENHGDINEVHSSDRSGWLDSRTGNLVSRLVGTPFWSDAEGKEALDEGFASKILDDIFGIPE